MSERDIVERLRDPSQPTSDYCDSCKCDKDKADAASEIDRLREERRWIPVGERLPKLNLDVLVVEDDGEMIVASVDGRGVWGHAFGSGNVTNGQCWPTHWMPLPAPPKVGEGD